MRDLLGLVWIMELILGWQWYQTCIGKDTSLDWRRFIQSCMGNNMSLDWQRFIWACMGMMWYLNMMNGKPSISLSLIFSEHLIYCTYLFHYYCFILYFVLTLFIWELAPWHSLSTSTWTYYNCFWCYVRQQSRAGTGKSRGLGVLVAFKLLVSPHPYSWGSIESFINS